MKKLLMFFVSMFMPVAVFAQCQSQQSGEFEFSECIFQGQGISSAAKSFWGNPKINSNEILGSDGSTIGNFILKRVWQCGTCTSEHEWQRPTSLTRQFRGNCANTSDVKDGDDQIMIAYVAKEVSAHGAEFCLTQISAASWSHPEFFIYYQVAKNTFTSTDGLSCRWYCEPGWDGDRCETKGLPESTSNPSTSNILADRDKYLNYTFSDTVAYTDVFDLPECETCSPAVNSIAVLDYKKTGKMDHGGWEGMSYQQEIVIGAVDFMQYGIKARPLLIGAYGGHSPCFDANYQKYNWSSGTYPYADVNKRKFLTGGTSLHAKAVDGGKERVLCLQGYTLNENCEPSTSDRVTKICGWEPYKTAEAQNKFNPKKHYKLYNSESKCVYYKCLNGMDFSADDGFACSLCKDTVQQGLCVSTNKCWWCNVGKCFNSQTCTCDECKSVFTADQMRSGKNLNDQCWSIIDTEEFRNCILGIKVTPSDEDE